MYGNADTQNMKELQYTCEKENLHPALQRVFFEKPYDPEAVTFKGKKSRLYPIKFILFVLMRAFGLNHYKTMGILGYETYLFDEEFVGSILQDKPR